jgi:hypothetical protein
MFFLIYFLYFIGAYGHNCSLRTPSKHEHAYLCREKLNATSIRVWLHLRFNHSATKPNSFSYYTFTLRTVDLIDGHSIQLQDRFEKRISDYTEIDTNSKENSTINIHNLASGRYEICVNLFSGKDHVFYYRSPASCLHIPWGVPEHEPHEPNLLIQISLMISMIMLFVTAAFCMHMIHQYVKSIRPAVVDVDTLEVEESDEDKVKHERARLLVQQSLQPGINPFELLVRRHVLQRYDHWSPD